MKHHYSKEGKSNSVDTALVQKKIVTDLYFLDFVPFFADFVDFVVFFFAAIFIYIEKDAYISFLILKIKKINLLLHS